ncbi:BED-type domain-containing protein [Meloidogyne graminicola]|uniref:BED-type domain-containing protein n=1 Tax=Meloidogyne graminicola TaxID=189291 RepID=A0A8S9ZL65_9BILA|nr:BED-type domain-containing protein [Meloidogyne graminicola]
MSDIWKYFDKLESSAKCKICLSKLQRKDGSTTGLWRHIEKLHPADFQQLKGINLKEKNEQLPSCYHFRCNIIPRMAQQIRKEIQAGVGNNFYAITTDGWSKPTMSPQIQSITIHWIDENFERHDAVLAAFPLDGLQIIFKLKLLNLN